MFVHQSLNNPLPLPSSTQGALRLMAARGQLPSSHERLLVEVFPLRNEQEAEALFVEINQARSLESGINITRIITLGAVLSRWLISLARIARVMAG